MSVFHDSSKCELRPDNDHASKPRCRGSVVEVKGIRLCQRHRVILAEIVEDANQEKRRHPVRHKGAQAA